MKLTFSSSFSHLRCLTLAAAISGVALTSSAQAAETIELTAIDGYPTTALWVKEFIDYFIPEVDRRLATTGNYEISWNQAFSGQIVKPRGVLEGLQLGLGDIGIVTTAFHHDKVPLQAVAYVTPFITTDPELVTRTIDDLTNQFPEMRAAFEEYNQVYLTNGVVLDSYYMFSKEPIEEIADLSGVKVNGAGTNLRYLDGIGAVGVGGSFVTFYNNIQTGVTDAAMLWPEAAVTTKLFEVAPHMMDADIGTVNSKVVSVNADTWASLPDEVKAVLQEVATDYRDHIAGLAAELRESSIATFLAGGGSYTEMNSAARQAWADTMPNIAQEWAENLDGQGLPGTAVLAAYMDALRAAGEVPARDWDRE